MSAAFGSPDALRLVGAYQWQVHCPVCGAGESDRAVVGGGDHEAVTVHPDRDDYDSPIGTRGGYVRVDLECSGGHSYALVVANHKGAEFLGLVPAEPTQAR